MMGLSAIPPGNPPPHLFCYIGLLIMKALSHLTIYTMLTVGLKRAYDSQGPYS